MIKIVWDKKEFQAETWEGLFQVLQKVDPWFGTFEEVVARVKQYRGDKGPELNTVEDLFRELDRLGILKIKEQP